MTVVPFPPCRVGPLRCSDQAPICPPAARLLPEVDERHRARCEPQPGNEAPQAGWPAVSVGVEL